jgi:DNA-binding transcriptional LysR family regulator
VQLDLGLHATPSGPNIHANKNGYAVIANAFSNAIGKVPVERRADDRFGRMADYRADDRYGASLRAWLLAVGKHRDVEPDVGALLPEASVSAALESAVELRQLRYFVAVAEELHFGRAAERLHMSQSPLSRAIRELERDLGVVLFVRTTRQVELTAAGSLLLERARRALAEIDGAIADVRRSVQSEEAVLRLGHGPFSGDVAARIVEALGAVCPGLSVRLEQEVTPDSIRRVGVGELVAAVVMESPAVARRHGVRVDTLRDEPLLAALPRSHRYASETAIPIGEFLEEPVLLPRESAGGMFNAWLRSVMRAHGFELERTMAIASAPWDRRLPPVANGEAVSVIVSEWGREPGTGLACVPFDPPLSFPMDLVSRWPSTEGVDALVETILHVRDSEGWLTERPARTHLPAD